jgi:hypothetical protein
MAGIEVLAALLQVQWTRVRTAIREDDRGAMSLEGVILAAIATAAAVAVGTIIYNLAVGKAESIQTDTPG